jgi:hypothetical protein
VEFLPIFFSSYLKMGFFTDRLFLLLLISYRTLASSDRLRLQKDACYSFAPGFNQIFPNDILPKLMFYYPAQACGLLIQ